MWRPEHRNVRALDRWVEEHYPESQPRHICGRWVDPDDCAACQFGLTDPVPPADAKPICRHGHPGCADHPPAE